MRTVDRRVLLIACGLACVGSGARSTEQPVVAAFELPTPQAPGGVVATSLVSANADGVYVGGSQLMLLGKGASFIWGRAFACRIAALKALPFGGVAVVGQCAKVTHNPAGGGRIDSIGPSVLRFDSAGKLLWSRTIDAGNGTELAELEAERDGFIYVTGNRVQRMRRYYSGRANNLRRQGFIAKLSERGKIVWARNFDPLPDEKNGAVAGQVAALANGAIAVSVNGRVAVLSTDGKLDQTRRFLIGGEVFLARHLSQAGGALVIAGRRGTQTASGVDVVAMCLDEGGAVKWANAFDVSATDSVWSVAGDSNTISLAGSTRRMGPTLEDKVHPGEGWLLRLDQHGNVVDSTAAGADKNSFFNSVTHAGNEVALAGSFGGRDGKKQVVAFNPMERTKSCPIITVAPVRVHKVEARSVLVAGSVSEIRIEGGPFDLEVSTFYTHHNDLCSDPIVTERRDDRTGRVTMPE